MKKLPIQLLALLFLLIMGCSGSDTYRGSWKALDAEGHQFEIVFDAKRFIVKDNEGKTKEYKYSQNSVSINNSVETYGINLSDGSHYKISFPIAKDESMGLITDLNGNALYTIGRSKFVQYNDLVKLK